MTLATQRLLGFAFASADLLIEIAPSGAIAFAIGASEALSGSPETKLVGRAWTDFIDADDRTMVEALLTGLGDGQRAGPVIVKLAATRDQVERAASLNVFRLPDNGGAISCALSRAAPPRKGAGRHGLFDRAAFEAAATSLYETARMTGQELELAMVEMTGLAAVRKSAPEAVAHEIDRKVAGGLRAQAHGGAATELGDGRFALIHQRGEAPDVLASRLMHMIGLDPNYGVGAAAEAIALSGDASTGQLVRAVRYSLDGFIRDGFQGHPPLSLGEAVAKSVRRTLVEVGALGDAVAQRRFKLVYQPVVDLKAGGALHHYEVLVRFGDNASPFPMIRMAEELDLIEPLDLAVAEQAVGRLAVAPDLKLAVNVSGRTIASGDFIQRIRTMLRDKPSVRGRLMFELTESASIDDLAIAERHLQALRAEGCEICLDDFGAGAASLAYLQQLSLDLVKIDGAYIRDLQHGGRESTFIRHLVTMCAELGVKTLAEMVESSQAEEAVRRAGVDYAQGWLYGAPQEKPAAPAARTAAPARPAARRVGAVDSWG
ncbi:MAG: EAL domain-containing protein [Phenylobacterium sp.]|uniref:EAL domain-containing protein n=1 Tax=Phenylobacterium sp. TaxID=1871053 RepID=UPI00391B0E60